MLIGFSTHHGTVTAAHDWDQPAERKRVRPALDGSYEKLFHQVGIPAFLLMLDDLGDAAGGLHEERLQRAIGVIYRPQTERMSHYFHVRLPDQLDAIIHVEETRALEPLERTGRWEKGELPEGADPEQIAFELNSLAVGANQSRQLHGATDVRERTLTAMRRVLA